jgi:hypothetical protein
VQRSRFEQEQCERGIVERDDEKRITDCPCTEEPE